MTVVPNSPEREAKKDEHRQAAREAFAKLAKLSCFENTPIQVLYDYVMCHPTGRRQFLYYLVQAKHWRVDRIDEWEYYHFLALRDLAELGELQA